MADPTPPAFREMVDFIWAHGPEVADLWVLSWQRTMPEIDFEARRVWFVEHLSGNLERGARVILAMTEVGSVAGFVMIDPATSYLDQIAVHPLHWGDGTAARLLAEARRLSPERIVLDVNSDNIRAVAFYRRAGFAAIGEGVNARSGLKTLKLEWRAAPAEIG